MKLSKILSKLDKPLVDKIKKIITSNAGELSYQKWQQDPNKGKSYLGYAAIMFREKNLNVAAEYILDVMNDGWFRR